MSSRPRARALYRKPGFVLAYVLVIFTFVCGFVSLGVDFGRVQLDKSELQMAADAAARHGAWGLPNNLQVAYATSAAAANSVEGAPVALQSSDIQVGIWNSANSTFTATATNPNSVMVTAQLTAARGTAVSTPFAAMLGRVTCDVHATSVATVIAQQQTSIPVSGQSDPWLAGMPNGTTANFYSQFGDAAPNNSPVLVPVPSMSSGQILNFQFTGTVSNWSGSNPYGCDGDSAWASNNWWAAKNGDSEHGIANVTAPLAAVIGVFLDDSQPDSTPAPPSLDFSTAASQDFSTLSPQLKQPFFIGDGLRADGVTPQNFVVPAGATRFYIGIMDFQQWSDNSGVMTTAVTKPPQITLVK